MDRLFNTAAAAASAPKRGGANNYEIRKKRGQPLKLSTDPAAVIRTIPVSVEELALRESLRQKREQILYAALAAERNEFPFALPPPERQHVPL